MTPSLHSRLRDLQNREIHFPTWRAVFLSKFFLVRRGIHRAINRHAFRLTGTVVDFGCGQQPYRSLIPADRYVGLDVPISGHPPHQRKPDVLFDGVHIPLADASVDGVLATEVFEHVFRLDETLAEIRRILKPGGVLLLTCPFCWPEHEEPYDFARYTPFALQDILGRAGFSIEAQEKEGHFVHVIPQLALWFALCHLSPRHGLLRRGLELVYCTIFNVVALLAGAILPTRWDLYFTNVVCAVRREPSALGPEKTPG